jgi:hypothetical protein
MTDNKDAVFVTDFRPEVASTLRGYATITLLEEGVTVPGIAIHLAADGRAWAEPSAPQLRFANDSVLSSLVIEAMRKAYPAAMIEISHELHLLRLLARKEAERRSARPNPAEGIMELPARSSDPNVRIPDHVASAIEAAIENPVRAAIRMKAREVGWMLYAKGGVDLMHQASDTIEDEMEGPRFAAALDKWWDRIGFGGDARGFWVA